MNIRDQFEEMRQAPKRGPVSDEAARLVIKAQEHHNHVRDQLNSILVMKDKGVRLGDEEDGVQLDAGTDKHKGFLVGILIALHFMGEFPIQIAESGSDDEEE